jgi:peroxiredoxin
MKVFMSALVVLAALLAGAWYRMDRQNAALLQAKLDAPFQEYAERHDSRLVLGQAMPDFALSDPAGKLWRLSDLAKGSRMTLVSGVRLGQEDSVRELIDLREAYHDLHARGLSVVAVVDADAGPVSDLIRRNALPFPVVMDTGGDYQRMTGVQPTPYIAVIDSRRRVEFLSIGRMLRRHVNEAVDYAFLGLEGRRVTGFTSPVGPNCRRSRRIVRSS